ncbi:MAG TPA: hypothetical protein VKV20_08945 [Ktedonobacteraceae bacterium]|jgi:hypothetical protein|nr:hypothetical protein [Ktedonobacteraceae bacterium]
MKSSGSGFEQIMEELLKQKQILEDLEAENKELHRQLADLRAGRGIVIEIEGQRFSLHGVVSQEDVPGPRSDLSSMETSAMPNISTAETVMPTMPETPIPDIDAVLEESAEETSPSTPVASPIMLEDMLLEEFTSAAGDQMAIWSGPASRATEIDEAEKAMLRRELMGSFLLE